MPPDLQSSLIKTSVQDVDSYMLPALLTTIFCCMPFGVVALIFANKVNVAKEEDELEAAVDASRKARRWYLRGIIAAVVFNVVALIVQFGRVILSRWANP